SWPGSGLQTSLEGVGRTLVDLAEHRRHLVGPDLVRPREPGAVAVRLDRERGEVVLDRERALDERVGLGAVLLALADEALLQLGAHRLQRADVAVDGAGLDAVHPAVERAEVPDGLPHLVRRARDLHL